MQMLSFSRRRGRPRSHLDKKDRGTPELCSKRAQHMTTEPLDYCLSNGLITAEQHWCGIHFRWLYTLKFGAPGVRALDPTHLGGTDHVLDSPGWREEREHEFSLAVRELSERRLYAAIVHFCIYGLIEDFTWRKPAAFLYTPRITEALELLTRIWVRKC